MLKQLVESWSIIQLLADGLSHSDSEIAAILNISAEDVAAHLATIRQLGFNMENEATANFRLLQPLDLLDNNRLHALTHRKLAIEIIPILSSTNDHLLQLARQISHNQACLTEFQYKGRGQYQREWLYLPGQSLAMSLLWHFPLVNTQFQGFSLIMGVAVADALKELGFVEMQLKWPNDLVYKRQKIGGILIESIIHAPFLSAVIGVGLNIYQAPPSSVLTQATACLADIYPADKMPDRTTIAATVLNHMVKNIQHFKKEGLTSFLLTWRHYDVLYDKPVTWQQDNQTKTGIAKGITETGQLLIETAEGQVTLNSSASLQLRY